MARIARHTQGNECRECSTFCDRVIRPATCVAAGCAFLYQYDDPLSQTRYLGCLQKVFEAEIDVEMFDAAERTRAGYGAVTLSLLLRWLMGRRRIEARRQEIGGAGVVLLGRSKSDKQPPDNGRAVASRVVPSLSVRRGRAERDNGRGDRPVTRTPRKGVQCHDHNPDSPDLRPVAHGGCHGGRGRCRRR
jgi:hypothetical protein